SHVTTINNTDGMASSGNSATNAGAVYVFKRAANGNWIQDAYLKASNAEMNDYFGSSVAISGATVAVAAYQESSNETAINNTDGQPEHPDNDSANHSGAVYVFKPFEDF
ncbi:MAG: FG-GAP repeat protein, partial [Leptospiraceae bacterium]|nr:FG-GAP repeat protein [Leptospiraceae bacterium]